MCLLMLTQIKAVEVLLQTFSDLGPFANETNCKILKLNMKRLQVKHAVGNDSKSVAPLELLK